MRRLKIALASSVALTGSFGLIERASAQTPEFVFGGGSTLASTVYRQLFDCAFYPIPGNTPPTGCGTGNVIGGTPSANLNQILYAPVGSGSGVSGFITNNPANFGTPSSTNTVPYTSSYQTFPLGNGLNSSGTVYPYANVHFGASDAVLSPSQYNTYLNNGFLASIGKVLQIPAFATSVAIAYNPSGLSINPANPQNGNLSGGSSAHPLQLSRKSLCGIFSGHITNWNDPQLTLDNGGVQLNSNLPITVVHRSDGSGTTFLTTSALISQCQGETGVVGTNNSTAGGTPAGSVSYAFPFTDRNYQATNALNGVAAAISPVNGPTPSVPVAFTTLANWPDLGNDQFGNAIANPGGGTFVNNSGSGGVAQTIHATAGAIGYLSVDFTQQVLASNSTYPWAANVQNDYDVRTNTSLYTTSPHPTFIAPTVAATTSAILEAHPPVSTADLMAPLVWSKFGISPDPRTSAAYPIAGFTWINFYQCYAKASTYNAIYAYLTWFYTSPLAQTILNNNGFAPIPGANGTTLPAGYTDQNWFNSVAGLFGTYFGIGGGGACAGIAGAPGGI